MDDDIKGFESFMDDIHGWTEIKTFDKAYAIANDAHKGQLRDEGIPYISHIDGVLDILRNELKIRMDFILSVAAMHDVLEDSDKYSYQDLVKYFGTGMADDVMLLTKKEGQNVQEYLQEINNSKSAGYLMTVKLADRLNNIRCLGKIDDQEKKARKCAETRKYYMDYAKTTNSYIYTELEKALVNVEKDV